MFADKVEIEVRAGKGGDGALSFRHEKYRAKGGPDGGDGGRGGNVIFEVDHNLNTLASFKRLKSIRAQDGQDGGTNRMAGKGGEDTLIKVPVGTMVYEDQKTGPRKLIADLTKHGQRAVLAKGGRGGFGNAHFTASTRQAPRIAEKGEMGDRRNITLELKLVADVGLVGLPNAGKSTLLSVITNAKPEIADYPFTTLVPNLGVVDFEQDTMLVADIPGLIEGASRGKGLGDEFLRHIERTAVLLHLIDSHGDVARDYQIVQKELEEYAVDLTQKPQVIVLTKTEHLTRQNDKEAKRLVSELQRVAPGCPVFLISAQAHHGLDALLRETLVYVKRARLERQIQESEELPVIGEQALPYLWKAIQEAPGVYRVSGEQIEGFARRTNWDSEEGVERLRDIMRKKGIAKELIRLGIVPGHKILIGPQELEWL
jgi:GTPase